MSVNILCISRTRWTRKREDASQRLPASTLLCKVWDVNSFPETTEVYNLLVFQKITSMLTNNKQKLKCGFGGHHFIIYICVCFKSWPSMHKKKWTCHITNVHRAPCCQNWPKTLLSRAFCQHKNKVDPISSRAPKSSTRNSLQFVSLYENFSL